MYVDKLDGNIPQDFYDRKSREWREEQEALLVRIKKHQNANHAYLDEGVRLLELSQHAVILYEKQSMDEKAKLVRFVFSNSTWKNGRLLPSYRKPFDLIAQSNIAYQKKKADLPKENGLVDFWLPNASTRRTNQTKVAIEQVPYFYKYFRGRKVLSIGYKPPQIPNGKAPAERDYRAILAGKKRKNPILEAMKYQEYLEGADSRIYQDAADYFGVSKARISQMLALLKKLPQEIIDAFLEDSPHLNLNMITERRLRPLTLLESEQEKILRFREVKNRQTL